MRLLTLLLLTTATFSLAAHAADAPAMPAPLKTLVDSGAQVRYLGRHETLDGWIAVQGGQQQYFYSTQDGKAVVLGLLFDDKGKIVTVQQVKDLQARGGEGLGNLLPTDAPEQAKAPAEQNNDAATSVSEQLFENIQLANSVAVGKAGAPVIYTFIDPQCPHCKEFLRDLRPAIDGGTVQVRVIPVGFLSEKSKPQAAFLLAAPDGGARLLKHLDGEELPVQADIDVKGTDRNLDIMKSWKFDSTPISIYHGKDGKVKIIQGRATDPAGLVADLVPVQ